MKLLLAPMDEASEEVSNPLVQKWSVFELLGV